MSEDFEDCLAPIGSLPLDFAAHLMFPCKGRRRGEESADEESKRVEDGKEVRC